MKVYNGSNMILGRLTQEVAKQALLGEEVVVINCANVIISGAKENTFAAGKQRFDRRGYPTKSAKIIRLPDRWVRRTIRGMLPWKHARGKEAFKRVRCHNGAPEELLKDAIILDHANAEKLPNRRFTTIGALCRHLGGKQV